ncbi:deoxyribodipyrimidine photo-lyase [Vibrio genomosp. F10]|uniref:deoxyribodipyrimidine photo-lyase n=1 Tax=Vibrio genomosp. F10 TaxID=723171 RepID=UPI000319EB06|nr:deoxyribodipyrimidine photo-lyase [Vibrio genomosp. F10]OEF01285.1 deoxyribodipyrimidine photolyase [Vibrio genomosp. F10 str. 9ZD137]
MSALLWIRRDLRIHDNPALCEAIKLGAKTAVYISTPLQWEQHNLAPIQADFIERHLCALAEPLAKLGIQLIHLPSTDYRSQIDVLTSYCEEQGIDAVCANSEPEINELERDQSFKHPHIELKIFHCDTILPVGTVLNKQETMFKVFTPFKNAWLKRVQLTGIGFNEIPQSSTHQLDPELASTQTSRVIVLDYPKVDSSRWPLSDAVMQSVIPRFFETKLNDYQQNRDYPGIKGTSGLSPYLAIGAISPRWLAIQLIQHQPDIVHDTNLPAFSWLNELIWRDFYKHLLFHFPNLAKGESFQDKYKGMVWQLNHSLFLAWCEGRTGYPLVDAAMKQLNTTGWMHNRLRMVVASFLTKHLLIDWRQGEKYFMSKLIDGDLSANNGGWQWAASTGCDAQPYFRIFNPITQSKKFDPNGDFIRKYLPELNNIPNKDIHFPHQYLEVNGIRDTYCSPIVDHKDARQRALDFFKQHHLLTG